MVQPKGDIMAKAVYLAQLEACKGTCTCKTCQILRKATESMTAEFLEEDQVKPGAPGAVVTQ